MVSLGAHLGQPAAGASARPRIPQEDVIGGGGRSMVSRDLFLLKHRPPNERPPARHGGADAVGE